MSPSPAVTQQQNRRRSGNGNGNGNSNANGNADTGTIPKTGNGAGATDRNRRLQQAAAAAAAASEVTDAAESAVRAVGGGGVASSSARQQMLSMEAGDMMMDRMRDQQQAMATMQQWPQQERRRMNQHHGLSPEESELVGGGGGVDALGPAGRRRQFLDSMPSQQILMDNIASLQERLSSARNLESLSKSLQSNDADDEDVMNGGGGGGDDKSAADSTLSVEKQDMEVALIDLEARKRQMDKMMRDFARAQNGLAAQMAASASSAPVRRDRSQEMSSLKRRLVDLQSMVDTYDRTSTPASTNGGGGGRLAAAAVAAMAVGDTGSTISDMSFTDPRQRVGLGPNKAADSLLAEMSEQLQLQKELHLRRKDLEELMRRDILENMQKDHVEADDEDDLRRNISSSDVRSEVSAQHRHHHHHHPRRRRRGDQKGGVKGNDLGSWLNGSAAAAAVAQPLPANHHHRLSSQQPSISSGNQVNYMLEPARQIQLLQRQVDSLQMEIGILNEAAALRHQHQMNGSGGGTTVADFLESASTLGGTVPPPGNLHLQRQMDDMDDNRLQLQQQQIQQLTQSLSQCFQTVLAIQHDVGILQCNVEKLVQHQQLQQQMQQQQQPNMVSNSSSAIGLVQQLQNGQQQQPGTSPSSLSTRHPQPDNLNRGSGYEAWQCSLGDLDFTPILPMPSATATSDPHQQSGLMRNMSGSGSLAGAPFATSNILGAIEASHTQWLQHQQQEAGSQQPAEDVGGIWTFPQQQQQQHLAPHQHQQHQAAQMPPQMPLQNGHNHWTDSTSIVGSAPRVPAPPALNNQVAPPMRANNYWDNFRSFSRQNRLSNGGQTVALHPQPTAHSVPISMQSSQLLHHTASSSSASPSLPLQQQQHSLGVVTTATSMAVSCAGVASAGAAAAAPNVAQVTPRQILAASTHISRPSGAAASAPAASSASTAFIEPNFGAASSLHSSPPRPRRKQKINREQNRESDATPVLHVEANNSLSLNDSRSGASCSGGGGVGARQRVSDSSSAAAAAAAMVFPMQLTAERNINRPSVSSAEQQLPVNSSANPVVNSLTRSIYNQVSHLISQHEQCPDQLARIFEDLQSFGNAAAAADSSSSAEIPGAQLMNGAASAAPNWQHQYRIPNSISDLTRPVDPVQSLDSPKLSGNKKFSFTSRPEQRDNESFGATGGDSNRPSSSETSRRPQDVVANQQAPACSSSFPSFQPVHRSLSEMSAMLDAAAISAVAANPPANSNGCSTAAANQNKHKNGSSSRDQSAVAVPKNVQRNQVSREREARKVGGSANGGAVSGNSSRKNKPRNMQHSAQAALAAPSPPEQDTSTTAASNSTNDQDNDSFVNIPIQFHPRIYAVSSNNFAAGGASGAAGAARAVGDVDEDEMAEADQDHSSPESVEFLAQAEGAADFHTPEAQDPATVPGEEEDDLAFAVGGEEEQQQLPPSLRLLLHGSCSGDAEVGLDRVPTRLSSNDIDLQMLAEEADNLQNLVGEVLDSSLECVEPNVPEPSQEQPGKDDEE